MHTRLKIIIFAALLPLIIYLWPAALGGDTEFLIVQGQSMLPTILPGSFVVTKQMPDYYIDDIVAFTQSAGSAQRVVVHRIIDETPQGYIIKGDNNPKKDPGYPTQDMILGRVVFSTPYVGDAIGLLRNPLFLVVSGVILAAIQMEQGRRKKRKEKIRRIQLGIPKSQTTISQSQKKKNKKPDYTLFFAALGFNIMTYVAVMYSVSQGIRPEGDMVTGFLFNAFMPSFAATLSFGLYFIFIFGMYFVAKYGEAKLEVNKIRKKRSLKLQKSKDVNTLLGVASFLWLMFVLMSLFHLMAIGQDMADIVS